MIKSVDLVVICAMEEEASPFLPLYEPEHVDFFGSEYRGPTKIQSGYFQGLSALVVVSGIGTTNAAAATTAVLTRYRPSAVVVAGTTGGLAKQIAAGDLAIGDRVVYHEANAVDFGYAAGQVPRMPESYAADEELVMLAEKAAKQTGRRNWTGMVGSSNSFVTAPLANGVRQTFPDLLAVDMETAAIAQVCWMFGVPWVSVRAVSDLCDPRGASQFQAHAPDAYLTSFDAVSHLAAYIGERISKEDSSQPRVGQESGGEIKTGRKPVRRALLSVSNKTGLGDLASALHRQGVELVATSSTAAAIAEEGIPVTEVSEVTGFPEILDGRVKTLHPAIHAGVLARQVDQESMATLERLGIDTFDLIVANLYPFASTLLSFSPMADCIEMIDIGGPTLVRAAAKNSESVAVVTDPSQYPELVDSLEKGGTTAAERLHLATSAFQMVADYDIAIANWLSLITAEGADYDRGFDTLDIDGIEPRVEYGENALPSWIGASYRKQEDLRYGENSHQKGALYRSTANTSAEPAGVGLGWATQLGGKPLSFNNLQDASAAALAADSFYDQPAIAIIKHANPCGIAVGENMAQAYSRALACDPLSAFGGVVASNGEIGEDTARQISEVFTEVVVANGYTPEALEVLRRKPNLRILQIMGTLFNRFDMKPINGGLLVQEVDRPDDPDSPREWKLVAGRPATLEQLADLEVAWKAVQYTKSNAIVLVKEGATVGVGMGQVNRLDSAKLAVERANTLADGRDRATGSVAASDAFFPFPDGLQVLIDAGVSAVVAPGGSIRDQQVIDAADQAGITLYFTERRHFWH